MARTILCSGTPTQNVGGIISTLVGCNSLNFFLFFGNTVLNVLFARAFAEHLSQPNAIVANSANPGLCYSELIRNSGLSFKIQARLLQIFIARTAEQGSRQLIWAALGPDGKEGRHIRHLNGAYVSGAIVEEPSDFVISKEGYETQQKIWVRPASTRAHYQC